MTSPGAKVSVNAGTSISYDLHSLGWKAFQDLCLTVLQEVLSQRVQRFFDSNDGGRDGAYHGNWKQISSFDLTGTFTLQCKFTCKKDKHIKLGDLTEELEKAKKLADKGLCDHYILLVNHVVKGVDEEAIKHKFESIPKIKTCHLLGYEWICHQIRNSPKLRMLVPRIYGLGDLSQILDERAYQQATELLSSLGDDLAKFVITGAYSQSADAISQDGLALLLGEPTCGKSTIAAALALGALDNWGCRTVCIHEPREFLHHWNPNEKQFFWVDDAFGATQLEIDKVLAWNSAFPKMSAAIKKGTRFVLTSRDYIFREADGFLKSSSIPPLQRSKVIIDVGSLTTSEREQILYNHIRLGQQPASARRAMKPHLCNVARHTSFKPETARRLGDPAFTRDISFTGESIEGFVAHPKEHLKEVLKGLDQAKRCALALVFMGNGSLPSPLKLSEDHEMACERMGVTVSQVPSSLNAMKESFVVNKIYSGEATWGFKHPTLRDALAEVIVDDPELLDIYLAGVPTSKLIQEVACGRHDIKGVKVVVPASRYDKVLKKFENVLNKKRELGATDSLCWFLAYRCASDFLSKFVERFGDYVRHLRVGSYMSCVAETRLLAILSSHNLLEEAKRLDVVNKISDLAVRTPDSDFLVEPFKGLFRDDEFNRLLVRISTELGPNAIEIVEQWMSDFPSSDGDTPSSHFEPLETAFTRYRRLFEESDPETAALFEEANDAIDESIRDIEENSEPSHRESYSKPDSSGPSAAGTRSVFDDVDE